MLTPGNRKLGRKGCIYGFGLPSHTTCPGRSEVCSTQCYSYRIERFRPSVQRRYETNLAISKRRYFVDRMVQTIRSLNATVVRIHVGGDFYSACYAGKWLTIMQRMIDVRFYFYTRSWRIPAIREVLDAMSDLSNVRAWFSCDRHTQIPSVIPPKVRIAWLMTAHDDLPPVADLVFRVHRLRRVAQKRVPCSRTTRDVVVCPVENGITGSNTDCEHCGVCWRPFPTSESGSRIPLLIAPKGVNT